MARRKKHRKKADPLKREKKQTEPKREVVYPRADGPSFDSESFDGLGSRK